ALGVVAVSAAASVRLLRGRLAAQRRADAERVRLTEETSRVVAAIETVKAAAAEAFVFDRWARQREALATGTAELGAGSQRLGIVAPLTLAAGMALVLGAGAFLVLDGSLTLGTLVAAQGFLVALLVPAGQIVYLGLLSARIRSQSAEIGAVAARALDPEVVTGPPAAARPVPAGPATLTLSGVVFGYTPDAPPVLDGLDLTVPAGARVALVGGSGSGKSTVVRIAIGELVPQAGTVAIDGVPRLALPRPYRTASIAYVPQTPVIVPGTIRENLTLLDPAIGEVAIADAIRDACIGPAIDARPLGLDEEVAAGGGFSGGELQRLAIARALVRRPRLLVLDEATSALDPVVEAELEANLRARGCTLLVVAHRLSTIRDADTIVVMDRGRVVQSGTYAELRETGRFAELIHA
ncbi:MAG: ATP-binding cassette domain-containing protein, partial [Chloroflexota bacterium]